MASGTWNHPHSTGLGYIYGLGLGSGVQAQARMKLYPYLLWMASSNTAMKQNYVYIDYSNAFVLGDLF